MSKNDMTSTMDLSQNLLGVVVNKVITVRESAKSESLKVEIDFDLSKVDMDFIIAKAMRTIVIDQQRKLRELGEDAIKAMDGKLSVLVTPETKRMKLTPSQLIQKGFATMTPEQQKAILDELKGQISK